VNNEREFSTLSARQKRAILKRHRGLIRGLAARLGVYPSAVSQTFWGKSTSRRITAAIEEELRAAGSLR
jgi:hypothetical protein